LQGGPGFNGKVARSVIEVGGGAILVFGRKLKRRRYHSFGTSKQKRRKDLYLRVSASQSICLRLASGPEENFPLF